MYKKDGNFKKGAKREKSEFDQKVLDIRRVTRVVAGGKRFRFRATVVLGDHKGRVGVGVDKGADTSEAIEKAGRVARKNLIFVPIKNNSIPHETIGKFSSAVVLLKPAGEGPMGGFSDGKRLAIARPTRVEGSVPLQDQSTSTTNRVDSPAKGPAPYLS